MAIAKGTFHRQMNLREFMGFLDDAFGECPHIKVMSKKVTIP